MFTAHGYEATAISEVAARAGIGQGTVYRYFGSKREILDHVIDFGVEKIMDSVQIPVFFGASGSIDELLESVRAAAERFYELIEREPQLLRLFFVEAGAIDPELAQRLLGFEAMAASLIAVELARGVADGWIRADADPEVLSHTILTLVGPGLARELLGTSDPQLRARSTTVVLHLLKKALRARSVAS